MNRNVGHGIRVADEVLPQELTPSFSDDGITEEQAALSVDVTDNVVDLYVDVNAVDDVVRAYITLYKPHWITADEVATYTIVA